MPAECQMHTSHKNDKSFSRPTSSNPIGRENVTFISFDGHFQGCTSHCMVCGSVVVLPKWKLNFHTEFLWLRFFIKDLGVYRNKSQKKDFAMNTALIRLLLKPDKDLTVPSSYHPLSLTNTDIQIISQALSSQLDTIIPTIIHNDQMGFIIGNTPNQFKNSSTILIYNARFRLRH